MRVKRLFRSSYDAKRGPVRNGGGKFQNGNRPVCAYQRRHSASAARVVLPSTQLKWRHTLPFVMPSRAHFARPLRQGHDHKAFKTVLTPRTRPMQVVCASYCSDAAQYWRATGIFGNNKVKLNPVRCALWIRRRYWLRSHNMMVSTPRRRSCIPDRCRKRPIMFSSHFQIAVLFTHAVGQSTSFPATRAQALRHPRLF